MFDPKQSARRKSHTDQLGGRLVHYPSAILAFLSMPLMRPSALGEEYSLVGLSLALIAAIIAVAEDSRQTRAPLPRAGMVVIACLFLAHTWLALRGAVFGAEAVDTARSFTLTLGYLVALWMVIRDARRVRWLLKLFSGLVLLSCASYAITLCIWLVAGIGTGHLTSLQIVDGGNFEFYFPVTITYGAQEIGAFEIPRFTGFAREPGWMAMWAGFCYFLAPTLFRRGAITLARPIFALALLGTVSTSGFAVFVVVLAAGFLLKPANRHNPFFSFMRMLVGIAVIGAAIWLAQNAPIFGVAAKTEMNIESYESRDLATQEGIRALLEAPLFGFADTASRISGVNLVAAIASAGLPYVIAVTLSFVIPAFHHRRRGAALPLLVLVATLGTAQPAGDSVLVFGAAMAVAAAAENGGLFRPLGSPTLDDYGRQRKERIGSHPPAHLPTNTQTAGINESR